MGRRISSLSDSTTAIRKDISSDYDNVKLVADNIDDVNVLADNIDNLGVLAASATDLGILAPRISEVVTVSDDIDSVVAAADSIDNINNVSSISEEVVTVSSISTEIESLFNDKAVLDSLFDDKTTLDSLFNDKVVLDSVYSDKAVLDSLFDDKTTLDSLFNDKATLDRVHASITNLDRVFNSIGNIDRLRISADRLDRLFVSIANLDRVFTSIANIDIVATDIDNVDVVAENISHVNTVSGINSEITNLEGIKTDVVTLSSISSKLESLYADKEVLDSLFNDKGKLDSLFSDKTILDSLYADKATLDSLFADKTTLDTLFNDKASLDRIHSSIGNIDRVFTSIAGIDRVNTSIENIDRVFTSISNIDRVFSSITNIDTLAVDIANIDTVADNVASVVLVADNIEDVNTAADNISEIQQAAGNATIATQKAAEAAQSAVDAEASALDWTNFKTGGGTLNGPINVTADITTSALIDGRNISVDGSKLDGIESGADVTDTANVTNAGALMDSEVSNLDQVKSFDSSDYATSAQGSLADTALQAGDNISSLVNDSGFTTNVGNIVSISTGDGLDITNSSGVVDISHSDTSNQGSVNNSGVTYVQDIVLDDFGHITGISSGTTTLAGLGYTGELNATADQTKSDIDALDVNAGFLGGNRASYFTDYTDAAIANVIESAPETMDTLNELAAALGDDPNFATTVSNQIGTKLNSADYTASDVLNKVKSVDGSGSGLDADKLDGQEGSYYYSPSNAPDPTLTIDGDASGSTTFANLGNATLSLTVKDDSHNHIIDNIDGLQTALNGKVDNSQVLTNVPAGAVFTDTNTWRGIDDVPVNGQTAESISSNWAYDHANSSTAHPRDTRNQIAGSYAPASHSHDYLPLSGGEITGKTTIDHTNKLSSSYSWSNSALQTTSIEIIDASTNDESVCPTLIMHNYGDGGVKLRMGNYGDKTLYLSSGQTDGAGNPTDDNTGTYFNTMKINGNIVYHAGNIPTWNQDTTGNAATATKLSTDRANYKGATDDVVAGQLMWKNYGNGHTIFDASNSTTPTGATKNNVDSEIAWVPSHPTLMGWNGNNTYGVRVDSSRYADQLKTARTISLAGDVTGSVSFNGTSNVSITAAITDDSHNHVISNIDGLQAALDSKLNSSSYTAADVLAKIRTVDGSGSGIDADSLDGMHATTSNTGFTVAVRDANKAITATRFIGLADIATKLATARTIALSGDVTGSTNFDGSGNVSITATIADDSHNHTIANIDGITISTATPSGGADGDIWLKY